MEFGSQVDVSDVMTCARVKDRLQFTQFTEKSSKLDLHVLCNTQSHCIYDSYNEVIK